MTIKEIIDQLVKQHGSLECENLSHNSSMTFPPTKCKACLRAAFRDVVKQVVEEMTGNEKNYVFTMSSKQNFNIAMGRRERISEEKATGENIIKSLE